MKVKESVSRKIFSVFNYLFLGLLLYPELEYRQWGYIVEEDRVVIRHGIFFVKKVIIPIIRIRS